ncbi:uncharacterized protein [Procambarus clarkii]|uniref:uncharacterized protein n=1 Tax=Procambarus clarkii TaxID=6728 RepID=UPI003743DE1E
MTLSLKLPSALSLALLLGVHGSAFAGGMRSVLGLSAVSVQPGRGTAVGRRPSVRLKVNVAIRTAKSECWASYVSTITSETPLAQIWKRIRKIADVFVLLLWTTLVVSRVLVDAQISTPGSGYGSQTRGQGGASSRESSGQQGSGSVVGGGPGVGSGPLPGVGLGLGSGQGIDTNLGQASSPAASSSQRAGGGDRAAQVSSGPRAASGSSGPASYAGARYGSPQVSRVDALFNPTVTQFVTIDRFVTLTDQAFQSVAVTLTSLTVQTVTTGTRAVVQTPVDDRVALETTVVVRPSTLTVTYVQSDFRIVTERSLDYVTIAHTSYVIIQTTYTTTATQVLSYTTTLVRTNINTKSTVFTDYRTVTDTVLVPGARYGYRQL